MIGGQRLFDNMYLLLALGVPCSAQLTVVMAMLAGLSFAGLEDIHQMNALKVLLATLPSDVRALAVTGKAPTRS